MALFVGGVQQGHFAVYAAAWAGMAADKDIADALYDHHVRRAADAKWGAGCHDDEIAITDDSFFQCKAARDGDRFLHIFRRRRIDGDHSPIQGHLIVDFSLGGEHHDWHFGAEAGDNAGGEATLSEAENPLRMGAVGSLYGGKAERIGNVVEIGSELRLKKSR